MGWPVYSERLIHAVGANVWHVYFVPVGRRAVVKNLIAVNWSTGGADVNVQVGGLSVGYLSLPATQKVMSVDVMIPVYGGEELEMATGQANVYVVASGYLFDDPTHATGPPRAAGPGTLPDNPIYPVEL